LAVVLLSERSDETLIGLIQEGSHQAFTVLVERHSRRFYRLCYRYTTDHEEAEDIVQNAFLHLWENPFSWDNKKNSRFTTWFYTVIVRRSLDAIRKRRYLHSFDEAKTTISEPAQQEESLLNNELATLLEKAISSLPARQRTALNLCFYEKISQKEAAMILGTSVKAVESLLIRAKTRIKNSLSGALL
jgi:RNA polymerase sigma-70 factor (ECF subfamily)